MIKSSNRRRLCSVPAVCNLILVLLLLSSSQAASSAQQAAGNALLPCPGLQQGACTAACQLATCEALADFYNSTFNADKPWDTKPWANKRGWELTTKFSCQQIIDAKSQQPSYCSWHGIKCCDAAGIAVQTCSAVHSVSMLKVQVNGLNGSLDSPGIINNMLQLHACGLTGINLQGNDLSGSMTPEWGLLTNLVTLDLANNWLNGTIPAALRSLKRLKTLSLGTNFLAGPIPSWLGEMESLEVLNLGANAGDNPDGTTGLTGSLPEALSGLPELRVLNLQTNALSGTIPRQICQRNNLTVLKLRSNMFEGVPLHLTECKMLTQLDISHNRFSGQVPEQMDWPQLAVLDASSNDFYGTIPDAVYSLPVLGYLNLANNRLTGSIKRSITLLTYLTELSLHQNQLTGIIDENLWFLPQLRVLDLSHNRMNGTISAAIGLTFGLTEVTVDNNQLTGAVPPEMGILRNLKDTDFRNTSMSCLGPSSALSGNGSSNGSAGHQQYPRCDESQLLPCFLAFSAVTIPLTDGSSMACPAIVRRVQADAVQECSGAMQLGDQASNLPDSLDSESQTWNLNPQYYQYRNCKCLEGFYEVWLSNSTLLRCDGNGRSGMPAWVVPVSAIISVAGIMLLLAAGLLVWLRMTVQLRPRWQREKDLVANRKKGMPNGGPATMVVTDIERYSELMQIDAPLATRFLGIHNAVLRRAAAAHAGHVVEQEGDSWSVAFHTPMDAVAFCLQVQQALAKTQWPGVPAQKRNSRAAVGDPSRRGSSSITMRLEGENTSSSQGVAWMQSLSAAVLRNSAGDSTFHAAAAVQSSPSAPGMMVKSSGRESACKQLAYSMPLPMTASAQDGLVPQLMDRSQTSSFSNLMVIGERSSQNLSSTRPDERQSSMPSQLITQGMIPGSGTSQGMMPTHAGPVQGSSSGCASRPIVQHKPNTTGREQSFSSVPSSPSSMRSSSIQMADSTGSLRSMLVGLQGRLSGYGSGRSGTTAAPRRANGSFSAGAALAAAEVAQLSGASDADQPGGRSRDLSASLGLSRARTVATTSVAPVASWGGPEGHRSAAGSRFWAAVGFASGSSQGSHGDESAPRSSSNERMRGLRVRMGVASGFVPLNTNIARCALFELAKAVSDMANGGQILLEAGCFEYVRGRLTELGTVDHRGYNDKLLASATKSLMRQHTSCIFHCVGSLLSCFGLNREAGPVDTDALALDMGQYYSQGIAPLIPAAAGELNSGLADLGPSALGTQDAAVAAVAAATMRCQSQEFQLQLYSILPRSLQSYAKLWMNQLTFRETTQQTGRGYFDAPGSGVAELSSAAVTQVDLERPPLPAVTMVFVKVEHGKALLRRRHDLARLVHSTVVRLSQVMLNALPEHDGRPDGYLCREQEGELKYMLAFRESARALEWCLLVQEGMRHVPWPKEVFEEYAASLSETGVFPSGCKQPVLRMGLAEGHPHSILPDHLGRADYHGPSVNLAARLMDTAALGGLVVASVEMADRIFSTWRFEAELGLHDLAGTLNNDVPQQPDQQDNSSSLTDTVFAVDKPPAQRSAEPPAQPALHREGSLPPPHHHQQQQQPLAENASLFERRMQQLQVTFQQHARDGYQRPSPSAIAESSNTSVSFGLPAVGDVAGTETPHMASVAAEAGAEVSGANYKGVKRLQSRQRLVRELLQRSVNMMDPPDYQQRLVHFSCHYIGTYAFKGCGALDVVAFTTDVMPVTVPIVNSTRSGSKGALLLQKSGVVPGLQDCPVLMARVVPVLQQAWRAAADVAAAAEHERILRKQATNRSFDLFRSSPEVERRQGTVVGLNPFRRNTISLGMPLPLSRMSGSASGKGSTGRLPDPKPSSAQHSAPLPALALPSMNNCESASAQDASSKSAGLAQKQAAAESLVFRGFGSFTNRSKTVQGVSNSEPLPTWSGAKQVDLVQLQQQELMLMSDTDDESFGVKLSSGGAGSRMHGAKGDGSSLWEQSRREL